MVYLNTLSKYGNWLGYIIQLTNIVENIFVASNIKKFNT